MFCVVRDRLTGKPLQPKVLGVSETGCLVSSNRENYGICAASGLCEMKNLYNPVTCDLGLTNMFVCVHCYKTHLCDLRHDCRIISTQEGTVCSKTGLTYESVLPHCRTDAVEQISEPNSDEVNIVSVILSYVYAYLIRHSNHYADVLEEVIEDGKFKKTVESAVYFTFNRVFKKANNLHKVSLSLIGQLFIQLIIGVHAKVTKYDPTIIKVSRRKREDGLLKQMRFEYGNAPVFRS